MSATDVIDRYFSNVRAVKDARIRGSITSVEEDNWIERLDDALFHDVALFPELERQLEGYVLLGSRDAEPGYSVRV